MLESDIFTAEAGKCFTLICSTANNLEEIGPCASYHSKGNFVGLKEVLTGRSFLSLREACNSLSIVRASNVMMHESVLLASEKSEEVLRFLQCDVDGHYIPSKTHRVSL